MMAGRIPDEVNFPALSLPYSTVRHAPILVCDMDRFGCATYSDFTVRHAPIYAHKKGNVVITMLNEFGREISGISLFAG